MTVHFQQEDSPASIELYPIYEHEDYIDPTVHSKNCLEISKKWLKEHLKNCTPSEDTENVLSYKFDWGLVYTSLHQDREYGLIGGQVYINYAN